MSAEQLCFFKFARPLVDLLGSDFFRQAPASPGVYVFLGEARRVLYVGQSKNLHVRLGYYKNAQPEREPRRIIRLVHQTRAIELHPCASPDEARLREIEMIQEHRPRFNVQHALSRTYSFFGLRRKEGGATLRLGLEATPLENEELIGAFKNRGLCRRALFACARVAWSLRESPRSVFDLPASTLDRPRCNEVFVLGDTVFEQINPLLRGDSPEFAAVCEQLVSRQSDSFLKGLFQIDHLTLLEFFALASRMRQLWERGGSGLLPQKEVDRMMLATQPGEENNCVPPLSSCFNQSA